jgi:hypothetical protein
LCRLAGSKGEHLALAHEELENLGALLVNDLIDRALFADRGMLSSRLRADRSSNSIRARVELFADRQVALEHRCSFNPGCGLALLAIHILPPVFAW